jgi:hypothetical protein
MMWHRRNDAFCPFQTLFRDITLMEDIMQAKKLEERNTNAWFFMKFWAYV